MGRVDGKGGPPYHRAQVLGPGSVVGHNAALLQGEEATTVRASTLVETYELPEANMNRLRKECPLVVEALRRTVNIAADMHQVTQQGAICTPLVFNMLGSKGPIKCCVPLEQQDCSDQVHRRCAPCHPNKRGR